MHDITQGTIITPNCTVNNAGTGPTPSGNAVDGKPILRATWKIDGTIIGFGEYGLAVPPGSTITMTMTSLPSGAPGTTYNTSGLTVGAHTISCEMDAPNFIVESNETNNVLTQGFNVLASSGGGSTRQAMLWPGAADCAVNIPFGDATTFSVRGINWGADDQFPQTSAFGMSIYGAGYTPIAQTSTEHHTVHVNTDTITAWDGYAGSDTSPTIKSDNYSLKTANLNDGHQGMLAVGTTNTTNGVRGFGMGAAAWLHVLGIVREADITQRYIGHAVMFALTNADLSRSSQFVAPAWRADGDASSTYSTSGTFSVGMRLGIPWATAKPTLTSTIGPLLWDALKTFGGFVSNRAGSGYIYFEATSQMQTWKTEFINSGDIAKIKAAIGQATNVNSGNQFAGPVTTARRPATLPPFA